MYKIFNTPLDWAVDSDTEGFVVPSVLTGNAGTNPPATFSVNLSNPEVSVHIYNSFPCIITSIVWLIDTKIVDWWSH
jgi:hypothetical protein